jgi:type II secretory pathway pseudopilin PulG
MRRDSYSDFQDRQRGAALLIFMLIVVIASTSMLLNRFSFRSTRVSNQTTMQTLALAKEALIGWSASHSSTPGMLPCPEDLTLIGTPNEGKALSSCPNGSPQLGRLPWRTLGLPDLRDDAGEKLWYALSPGFRQSPINSDTPAQLTVDGISNRAIAIIFSAGAPLPGQNRPIPTVSSPPDVTQYLDGINNSGTGSFVTTGSADLFNDRMIAISGRDLFVVVEKRVGREVRQALLNHFCGVNNFDDSGACIATGGNRFFPRPSAFIDPTCFGHGSIITNCNSGIINNAGRIPANPAIPWEPVLSLLRGTIVSSPNWFQVNGWREHVYYAVANACIEGTLDCNGTGTLTANQPPGAPALNQKVVIIVAGSAFSTTVPPQYRSSSIDKRNIANYLEDENAVPLDDVYTRLPTNPNTPFNDQVITIH